MNSTGNIAFGSQTDYQSSPGRAKSPANVPASGDILFLKRLLYLKASIDNETTINTYSVPFEQERMRDERLTHNQQRMNGSLRESIDDSNRGALTNFPDLELQVPNSSHGFRLRNAGNHGATDYMSVKNQSNHNSLQLTVPITKKIVQTAEGGKRARR
jgi:hypothetical protein